jgi:aryl-alcohol dehydrogenase-like predicted oxidoreductase
MIKEMTDRPQKTDSAFPRIELQPGYSVSRVIKGGWQLAGGHGAVDERQAIQDMQAFVDAGITTFDCADIYTGVEELIGKFVKQNSQIQIHTKYVPDLDVLPNIDKAYTERIIDRSLLRLGVETLDLVQFHWWDYSIPLYIDAALHLVDLQKAGKIRCIGVTNFDGLRLRELLDAEVPVVSNQIQYSVFDRRPEEDLQQVAKENGIFLLCYGTLAGGYLSERYLGKEVFDDVPENRSLVKYRLIIEEFGGMEAFQSVLRVLDKIAHEYDVGIGEVAAQYILQKPCVAGVIIGARNTKYLGNLKKLKNFTIDEEDLQAIDGVIKRSLGPSGPVYGLERDREGRHGQIMKYNLNEP